MYSHVFGTVKRGPVAPSVIQVTDFSRYSNYKDPLDKQICLKRLQGELVLIQHDLEFHQDSLRSVEKAGNGSSMPPRNKQIHSVEDSQLVELTKESNLVAANLRFKLGWLPTLVCP